MPRVESRGGPAQRPQGHRSRLATRQEQPKSLEIFQVTTFQTEGFAPEKSTLVCVRCGFIVTEKPMGLIRVAAMAETKNAILNLSTGIELGSLWLGTVMYSTC